MRDIGDPVALDRAEDPSEVTSSVLGPEHVEEEAPRRPEGLAEITHELRGDLADSLRFPSQLAEIVAVIDDACAEAPARMYDEEPITLPAARRTDELDVVRSDTRGDGEPGPVRRHGVVRALYLYERAARHFDEGDSARCEGMDWQRQHRSA